MAPDLGALGDARRGPGEKGKSPAGRVLSEIRVP